MNNPKCDKCGTEMAIDEWNGWTWTCFHCDHLGRIATDEEIARHEKALELNKCKCSAWARTNQKMLTEHHEDCPYYDLEAESIAIIDSLIRGIEAWASDEDGVHQECWKAYRKAKIIIGQSGDCGEDLTEDSEEMADKKIAIAHDF